jgi:hypothetical protein
MPEIQMHHDFWDAALEWDNCGRIAVTGCGLIGVREALQFG